MQNVIAKRIEAEKQERIEQILKAARTLFVKKGYLGATMRDIAQEAELSTGAIYVYFSGKDEIYAKVCEEAFHVVIGLIKKARPRPFPLFMMSSSRRSKRGSSQIGTTALTQASTSGRDWKESCCWIKWDTFGAGDMSWISRSWWRTSWRSCCRGSRPRSA